jgi:uncharacterized protein (TIGR00266 family)
MDHEIKHRPSYAQVTVDLGAGERVRAEAGAMVSYTDGIEIETKASGGIFDSLKRSVLGGESFFQNTYHATTAGQVTLAPALSGDVVHHDLDGRLLVQSTSYLAAHPDVELDTKFGGGRTFFGGEGLFLLELTGQGDTFLSSYGAIEERTLDPGERLTVDTGHIVAFDTDSFDVRRVGGLRSTLFSGEGLVCDFEGPGRVWIQSRSPDAFLSWLIPKLPQDTSGGA